MTCAQDWTAYNAAALSYESSKQAYLARVAAQQDANAQCSAAQADYNAQLAAYNAKVAARNAEVKSKTATYANWQTATAAYTKALGEYNKRVAARAGYDRRIQIIKSEHDAAWAAHIKKYPTVAKYRYSIKKRCGGVDFYCWPDGVSGNCPPETVRGIGAWNPGDPNLPLATTCFQSRNAIPCPSCPPEVAMPGPPPTPVGPAPPSPADVPLLAPFSVAKPTCIVSALAEPAPPMPSQPSCDPNAKTTTTATPASYPTLSVPTVATLAPTTTDSKKTGTLGLWLLIAAAGVGVYMVARKQ